jgi:hypothetical protein
MLEWTTHTLFPSGRCSPSCRASHPHRIAQELPEQDWVPTMGGREGAVPGVLRLRGSCGARGGPTDVRDLGSCDQWPSLASGDDPSRGVEPPSSQFHSRLPRAYNTEFHPIEFLCRKTLFCVLFLRTKSENGQKNPCVGLKNAKAAGHVQAFPIFERPHVS